MTNNQLDNISIRKAAGFLCGFGSAGFAALGLAKIANPAVYLLAAVTFVIGIFVTAVAETWPENK